MSVRADLAAARREYSHLSPSGNRVQDVGCFVQIQCAQQLDQGNIYVKGKQKPTPTDSKFALYRLFYPAPVNLPAENVVSCLPGGCPSGSSNVKHPNATARCPLRDACGRHPMVICNVCIYVCMCMCIYVDICLYIYIYTHIESNSAR